MSPQLLNCDTT